MRGSNAFIQGIGNARLSMLLVILDSVILRVGLSYVLGIVAGYGFYGFVLGYSLSPFGTTILGMIYFLSEVWAKRKTLVEEL